MRENKVKCGGVALFNGILFTSDIRQVQIERKDNNTIYAKVNKMNKDTRLLSNIPILRGILGIKGQIGNAAPKFVESSGEKESSSKIKTLVMYLLLIITLILVPILVSIPFSSAIREIVQAIVIFIEFILYVFLIHFSAKVVEELDMLFMYHGAEHKVVNAYEKYGEKKY